MKNTGIRYQKAKLDVILLDTKFTHRTKALWAYFRQGDAVIEKQHTFYGYRCRAYNQSFLEKAQGDKVLALNGLNYHLNGHWFDPTDSRCTMYDTTRACWAEAIRLIDEAKLA